MTINENKFPPYSTTQSFNFFEGVDGIPTVPSVPDFFEESTPMPPLPPGHAFSELVANENYEKAKKILCLVEGGSVGGIKELDLALGYINESIRLKQSDLAALLLKVKILKNLCQYPEISLEKKNKFLQETKNTYLLAIELLSASIRLSPFDPSFFQKRAELYLLVNQPLQAAEDFQKCIELGSKELEHYTSAISCYRTLKNIDGEIFILKMLRDACNKALTEGDDDFSKKIRSLLPTLEVEEYFPDVYTLYGSFLLKEGKHEEVLHQCQKFIAWHLRHPESPYQSTGEQINRVLAVYFSTLRGKKYTSGELLQHVETYKKVVAISKSECVEALRYLADMHSQSGSYYRAFMTYSKANMIELQRNAKLDTESIDRMHKLSHSLFHRAMTYTDKEGLDDADKLLERGVSIQEKIICLHDRQKSLEREKVIRLAKEYIAKQENGTEQNSYLWGGYSLAHSLSSILETSSLSIDDYLSFLEENPSLTIVKNKLAPQIRGNYGEYVIPLVDLLTTINDEERKFVQSHYQFAIETLISQLNSHLIQADRSPELYMYYEHFLLSNGMPHSFPRHMPMVQSIIRKIAKGYKEEFSDREKKLYLSVVDYFFTHACKIYDYCDDKLKSVSMSLSPEYIAKQDKKFYRFCRKLPAPLKSVILKNVCGADSLYAVVKGSTVETLTSYSPKYLFYATINVMAMSLKYRLNSLLGSGGMYTCESSCVAYFLDPICFETYVYPIELVFDRQGWLSRLQTYTSSERVSLLNELNKILPPEAWDRSQSARNNKLKKSFLPTLSQYIQQGPKGSQKALSAPCAPLFFTETVYLDTASVEQFYSDSFAKNTGITSADILDAIRYNSGQFSSVKKRPVSHDLKKEPPKKASKKRPPPDALKGGSEKQQRKH